MGKMCEYFELSEYLEEWENFEKTRSRALPL